MSSDRKETINETSTFVETADSVASSSTGDENPTVPQHLLKPPRQDVKEGPPLMSPDLCHGEKKRPAHVGDGDSADPAMPDTKRFKIHDDTLVVGTTTTTATTTGTTTALASTEPNEDDTRYVQGATTATGDAGTDDAAGAAGAAAGAAPAIKDSVSTPPRLPQSSTTSEPPVVSPRDTTKRPATATTISSFSSSNSSSSEGMMMMMPPQNVPSRHTATPVDTNTTTTNTTTTTTAPSLKSTLMAQLHSKYYGELEYMLQEFRKLERQLLGVKGNGSGIEESSGSRERREKLHSFILHLEDTIRQIEVGCCATTTTTTATTTTTTPVESSTSTPDADASTTENRSTTTTPQHDQDDVESVQKLEDHILANLLPVKVRLKRQLAAQQGATRNPIGMPATPRGLQPSGVADKGKGTFAAAAEEKRKQAEALQAAAREHAVAMAATPSAPSQFGQPILGGASSLTQKLHGSTLGSQQRIYGHGVGTDKPPPVPDPTSSEVDGGDEKSPNKRILYAGMAPGSNQHDSGVSAAAGVHCMIIETPPQLSEIEHHPVKEEAITETPMEEPKSSLEPPKIFKPHEDPNLTEEERAKLHKERRRRKKHRELERREKERQRQLFLQQKAAAQASAAASKGSAKKGGKASAKSSAGKKKGPRTVEYICALCSEAYSSTCDYNPWWALASHECPKCRKTQIPRIDITSPVNAIEYHPALLAHAEEGPSGGSGGGSSPPPSIMHPAPSQTSYQPLTPPGSKFPPLYPLSDSDEESDLSELSDAANLSEDSYDSDDSEDDMPLTEGELAEIESFGKEYEGPKLTPEQSSRLLILIGHGQTCPGRHKLASHRDCCNSVKFLMLHIRDCPGTTSTFDVCPFPWCRKVKHLLYHLVACPRPRDCAICSPIALSPNWQFLIGLTNHRREKQRERTKVAMAATAAAKAKPPPAKVACVAKSTKPVPYRPPVKKPVLTNKPFKPVVAKHTPPAPPRASLIARPGANAGPGHVPPTTKPTNGVVVVKSLVKPIGRSSVVVVKARPHRPVVPGATPTVTALSGTKPTVVPLPGVDDATSNQKCVSSVVVSTITTDATPTTSGFVPLADKRESNDLFHASQPSETVKSAADASVSAQCSSEIKDECSPTELASQVSTTEGPAGEERSTMAMDMEPYTEGNDCTISASVTSNGSTEAALPIPVYVGSLGVATAATVAATMNTDATGSSSVAHPGVGRPLDDASVKTDNCRGGSSHDTVNSEEPAHPEADNKLIVSCDDATMTDHVASMKKADANTSSRSAPGSAAATDSRLACVDGVEPIDTTKRDLDSKSLLSAMQSSVVTPPTSSATNKPANPTPLTIQQTLSEASQSQTQTRLGANIDVVAIDVTPSGTNTSLASSAIKPGELTHNQKHMASSLAHEDLQRQTMPFQERPAPPRFPEVPAVVGQEGSDGNNNNNSNNNEEAPHEVPPV